MKYILQSLVEGLDIHREIQVLQHGQGVAQVTVLYGANPIHPVPQYQPVVHGAGHQENQSTNHGPMFQI